MLGGLFAGYGSGGNSSSLASGANPTQINGEDRQNFVSAASLPATTSASEVVNSARKAGELEAQKTLLKALSRSKLDQVKHSFEALQTRLDFNTQIMGYEAQFQKAFGRHGKALLRYSLSSAETNANFSGYQASFGDALKNLDF